jgi:hypothetical protein
LCWRALRAGRSLSSRAASYLLDGQPVKRTGYGYLICNDAGKDIEFRLRPRFLDPVPDLVLEGNRVVLVPPLKFSEYAWVCLSLPMIVYGGLLGSFCSVSAIHINFAIFRTVRSPMKKYLLTGTSTFLAVLLHFAIVMLFVHEFGIARWRVGAFFGIPPSLVVSHNVQTVIIWFGIVTLIGGAAALLLKLRDRRRAKDSECKLRIDRAAHKFEQEHPGLSAAEAKETALLQEQRRFTPLVWVGIVIGSICALSAVLALARKIVAALSSVLSG